MSLPELIQLKCSVQVSQKTEHQIVGESDFLYWWRSGWLKCQATSVLPLRRPEAATQPGSTCCATRLLSEVRRPTWRWATPARSLPVRAIWTKVWVPRESSRTTN
jgi:hypothetical protein